MIHHFFSSVISPLALVTAELPPMWWESENLILVEDVGSKKLNHQPTKSTQADSHEANLNLAQPLIAAETSDLNNNGDNFTTTFRSGEMATPAFAKACWGPSRRYQHQHSHDPILKNIEYQSEGFQTSTKTSTAPLYWEKHTILVTFYYILPLFNLLILFNGFPLVFWGSTQYLRPQVTDRNSSRCRESRVEERFWKRGHEAWDNGAWISPLLGNFGSNLLVRTRSWLIFCSGIQIWFNGWEGR